MNERTKKRAGTLVAAVLAADGLLHAYWATGRLWPAKDPGTLARVVLNSDKPSLFRPIIVGPLACLLFLSALTVLARVHRLGRFGRLVPAPLPQIGTPIIGGGLLLRGVQGIVIALRGDDGTMFYRLNLVAYTPACLMLSAAAAAATRSERSGETRATIPNTAVSGISLDSLPTPTER